MKGLIAGIVGLPLLAGGLIATILHRLPATHRPLAARVVTLATVALTALCAAALAFCSSDASLTIPEWLPGAGPMSLTAGASGLYAVLATTVSLFLVLLSTPTPPLTDGVKKPAASTTRVQVDEASSKEKALHGLFPMLLLALAGANGALLADHFLLRYVALEIAALCILLTPLAEKPTPSVDPSARGGYLLLRVGDAGLLAAILILWRAAGTLHIDPALEAGKTLAPAQLGWTTAGLVLAVWVKLGAWPFHIWGQAGRRLSLASQAWLYATVVPNLGLYLLYRVTPLLAYAGPVQTAALWIGAIGALLAALLAMVQPEPRAALVHVGAAQGGLMLLVAAAGVKSAVWLGLLVLTPLRLLLFLASDAAQKAKSCTPRRVAASMLVFGGLALLAFNLVTLWWAREGVSKTALFIAQVAAALVGAWTVAAVSKPRLPTRARFSKSRASRDRSYGFQWTTIPLLSTVIFIGGLAFGPLARFAAGITHATPPAIPTLRTLTGSLPALLAAAALTIVLWLLRRWSAPTPTPQKADRETWDSEKELARIAGTLHAAIEVTILERIIAGTKRAVAGSARAIWIVEHRVLEGIIDRAVQAVMDSASIAYRTIEQEGLEGILRRVVSSALALGQSIQRWHTGQLRRNLLWVPVALALAIVALAVYGK